MEGKALLNDKSYYAVIFTSIQSEVNKDYEKTENSRNGKPGKNNR